MAQYELNIQDYLRILKKRRWIILLTAISVIGSVAIFTNIQTPVYQAAATVKVEPSLVIPGVSTDQAGWDVYTALNTEVKIIKSAIVSERAAKKLGLFKPSDTEEKHQSIVGAIQSKIEAERIGDTNLITISAMSSDPAETAHLANVTAEVYIEKGIEDRNRRARELRQFIEVQLNDSETKLKEAEDKLKIYTEKTGAKGIGGYLSNRLVDLQNRKSELLKKYTNNHPEVARLVQQIQNLEIQMKELPAEELEYARFTREVNINEELYTLLAKRYKEAQISEADRVQSAFIVTPAVQPSIPIKPNRVMNMSVGIFLGIFLGFILALVIENLDTSIGTIEEVEKYVELPVLGIIPHAQAEGTHKLFIKRPASRSEKNAALRSKLIVFQPPKSSFVESYHILRTNLKFSPFKKSGQKGSILVFTSAGIGEGKTLTASNYAMAVAQSGIKTLLIEADLRRPSLHHIFGMKRGPGLSECIIGTKKWNEVMKGTTDFLMGNIGTEKILQMPGIENLHLITSGSLCPNPNEMISSPEMTKIIKECASQFDIVILDSTPVLLFSDTTIIGSHASGIILVYQVGRMTQRALKRAKDQMQNTGVPIIGVVLNNAKTSDMGSYYGYGYQYSYKYYTNRQTVSKQ